MSETTQLLRDAGEALFGSRWQTDMAGALGVSDRTIRRWASGNDAMPARVFAEISALIDARQAAFATLKQRLGG